MERKKIMHILIIIVMRYVLDPTVSVWKTDKGCSRKYQSRCAILVSTVKQNE